MFTELQSRKKKLLVALICVCVLAVLVLLVIEQKKSALIAKTELKISEQETTLSSIALLTSKDGADPVVLKIIKDCSPENRALFDEKLSNLPTLKGQELVLMEQLFNACGNFFAERKAVMVARLNREYQVYVDLIEIQTSISTESKEGQFKQEQWNTLVEMETKRSDLYTKLVDIQGSIIRALKNNVTISSDEMQLNLVDAQKTKVSLNEVTLQIDSLLQEILNL